MTWQDMFTMSHEKKSLEQKLDILMSEYKDCKEVNVENLQGLNQHLLKVEPKYKNKSGKLSSQSAGKSFHLEATFKSQGYIHLGRNMNIVHHSPL